MTFGEKLQELRKTSGLSQEQLAEKCSISRQSVSKWELGQGYPETEKLLVLCRALDVDLDYLLRDEIEKKSISKNEISANPYRGFFGQWVTLLLYDKNLSILKLAAITAMNDDYIVVSIVFGKESKMGVIKISEIKTISQPMVGEKRAALLSPITTFEIENSENPYSLMQGKPCVIMLKQNNNSIFKDTKSFVPAEIVGITDEWLTISFRQKELMIKTDDILIVVEH